MERAAAICEKTRQLDERAVDVILARELPYNLKNLIYVSDEIKKGTVEAPQEPERIQDPETIKARRMLEEVRLSMTVTANLRLLRSGFHIETAPMERLVENLKKAEGQDAGALVQEADAEKARAKSGLYQQTLFTLESIRNAPAAVAAQVGYRYPAGGGECRQDKGSAVPEGGRKLRSAYDCAEKGYGGFDPEGVSECG